MQFLKIALVTLDPAGLKWRTLVGKLTEVTNVLNTTKNGTFTIEVEARALIPEVTKSGKITHDWMDSISGQYRDRGYDFIVLHMSNRQGKKFGISTGLNGAAQNDSDTIGEAYIVTDETDRRGPYNKFVQVFLHEMRHMLKRGTREKDDTHELHGTKGDIRAAFTDIDMDEYDPHWYYLKNQVTLLQHLVNKLKGMVRRKTLYEAVKESLNVDVSPKDRARDEVGCAESASEVIRKVLPDFPVVLGTWSLLDRLQNDTRFKKVTIPMPGTIIISPTGESLRDPAPFPGHVGFFLEGMKIASNTSATGMFEQNYTLETWKKRWGDEGKYPIYYYQLI